MRYNYGNEFVNGNGMDRGLVSDQMVRDPTRNFLYDDYMDNDLFGQGNNSHTINPRQSTDPFFARKPSKRVVEPYEENIFDDSVEPETAIVDPINLPLETYSALSRARRRRGFGRANQFQVFKVPSRRFGQRRTIPMTEEIYEYYEPFRPSTFRQRTKVLLF